MIGDPLGRYYTYKLLIEEIQLRMGISNAMEFSTSRMIELINRAILDIAKILKDKNEKSYELYCVQNENLSITGTVNPYKVDLSALSIYSLKHITHVTGSGTRTPVIEKSAGDGERISKFSLYANSLFFSNMNDSLYLWKGSSFTMTIASDKIHLSYYRLPIVTGVSLTSKIDIPDTYAGTIVEKVLGYIGGSNAKS